MQHSHKCLFLGEMLHLRRSFSTGLVDFKSYFGCCLITPKKRHRGPDSTEDWFVWTTYSPTTPWTRNTLHNAAASFSPSMRWSSWASYCQDDFLVWKMMAILFIVMPWSCVILLRLRNKWMVADGLAGMLSALVSGAAREIRLWHAHSGGLRKNY